MAAKRNKATGRDYAYDTAYQASPDQIKNRSSRNKARRKAKAAGMDIAGKDVDHIKPIKDGGTNALSNLRAINKSKNRARKT